MMVESRGLADWARDFLSRDEPRQHLNLVVEGCGIRVSTNSAVLCTALTRYYREYLAREPGAPDLEVTGLETPPAGLDLPFAASPPGPGKTRVKDEYVDLADGRIIRKRITGLVFLAGHDRHLCVGPCLANQNQVVNFINNRFIQWQLDRGYLLCHAAAVVRGDRGLALAGVAGLGKSTLALHLLNRGLDLLTNDRLLVRGERGSLEMLGLPKFPRVNPGTILNNPSLGSILTAEEHARFRALPAEELWTLEEKYDVDVSECFGAGRVRLRARMVGAVLLNWQRGGGPTRADEVRLADRADLLAALIKQPGIHYCPRPGRGVPDLSPEVYREQLRGCRALELRGGVDFDAGAEFCLRLLV